MNAQIKKQPLNWEEFRNIFIQDLDKVFYDLLRDTFLPEIKKDTFLNGETETIRYNLKSKLINVVIKVERYERGELLFYDATIKKSQNKKFISIYQWIKDLYPIYMYLWNELH